MQRDHVRQRSRWYGTAFSPLSLFLSGANGAWYDPSDFSTLFQDAAGTVPVTAVGQPVGRILDKSGRSNHAYNPSGNSANYPVLQQDGTGRYYLLFNGVNQWLRSIGSIDLTYGDKVFVSAGARKLSDASRGMLCEFGSAWTNPGSFALEYADPAGSSNYLAGSNGGTLVSTAATGYAAPITNVISSDCDISGKKVAIRVNGSQRAISTTSQGAGAYGNNILYLGSRAGASFWLNGRMYGLVVAGKAASASEIASVEAWLNQKTGAY